MRVAVADTSGELISGFSETAAVEVETNFPLDKPRLISPQSGKSARVSRGRISLAFTWADVKGADYYTLEMSNSPDFKLLIGESITPKGNSHILKQAELSGTIYWRVRAHGKDGTSAWSDTFNFTIK
jgi:hypothetical protein